MARKNPTELVNDIEVVLKKYFIVSASFQDIHHGIVDNKRRRHVHLINAIIFADILLNIVWIVAPANYSIHFYSLNPLHGFGRIGRFVAGFYAIGLTMVLLHSLALLKHEKAGTLTPLTDLRHMYHRLSQLGHLTAKDSKQLIFFLKLLSLFRWSNLVLALPLAILMGIGSIVTAYNFNSILFFILRIPVSQIECFGVFVPSTHIFTVVHLLTAQSSRYLVMRLDKNYRKLYKLLVYHNTEDRNGFLWMTNRLVFDLHSILNEIKNHNQCIKDFLRDALLCIECVISCLLVFILESDAWYEQIFLLFVMLSISIFLSLSTLNASYLFVRIQSTTKLLHSLQRNLPFQPPVSRHRSPPVLTKKRCHYQEDVIKVKKEILRLIQRMSSPFLKVGFTEGDTNSFTPLSAAASVLSIICMSLMFLNAKYSSV